MSFYRRRSPQLKCAQTLVHNLKWGDRAILDAIGYGDVIIPLIRQETNDFEALNVRNAFWIAETLGFNASNLSHDTLLDLYHRKDKLQKVVGAVGLSMQSAKMEPGIQSLFVSIIQNDTDQAETHLAIIALGYAREPSVLSVLEHVLNVRPQDYWHHAYACEAIARLGVTAGTTVLRDCLQDDQYHALPNAFRALIALGDKNAVPLAINRITPQIKGYNSGFVVKELELVTGKHFGYKQERWLAWWTNAELDWVIPTAFLVPWDEQPERR